MKLFVFHLIHLILTSHSIVSFLLCFKLKKKKFFFDNYLLNGPFFFVYFLHAGSNFNLSDKNSKIFVI